MGHIPYDDSLYVPRPPLETNLINAVLAALAAQADPAVSRSFVIQAAPQSGKSWTIRHLADRFAANPLIIVLHIDRSVFIDPTQQPPNNRRLYLRQPEELFLPLVKTLRATVETRLPALNTSLLSNQTDPNEIISDLASLADELVQAQPQPYVVIVVDGMEEFAEESRHRADPRLLQEDLLYRLEQFVIEPLFTQPNTALIATRRAQTTASWHTFIVHQGLHDPFFELEPIQLADQYAKIVQQAGSPAHAPALAAIQADLLRYGWDNAGVNSSLLRAALEHRLPLPANEIAAILEQLLQSPLGQPMPPAARQHLATLLDRHYPDPTPPSHELELLTIKQDLQISDSQRRNLINTLTEHGIGKLQKPYFKINNEIITLHQELQQPHHP